MAMVVDVSKMLKEVQVDKLITLAMVLGIPTTDAARDDLFAKVKAEMEARAARAAEVPTKAPSIIERVASGPVRSLEMLPQRESKRAARRARGRSKGARG